LFKEIKQIGKGAFGAAYLVMTKENEFLIAKKINMERMSERERKGAQLEAQLLREFNSKYIVQYKNCFTEDQTLIIIMEYCQYGDLAYQIKHSTKPYSED
jgi:NIMA (never in mitosis gene a)-related kinase